MNREFTALTIQSDVLKNCGLSVCKAGAYFDTKQHFIRREGLAEWILIYCSAGKGFLQQRKRRTPVLPGRAVLIPPGCPHAYGSDPDDPWKIYWAHFLWEPEHIRIPILKDNPQAMIIPVAEPEKVHWLLSEIFHILPEQASAERQTEAGGYLLSLLCSLSRGEERLVGYGPHVYAAEKILRQAIYRDITLDLLARQVGLSKYHLVRCFCSGMGTTPMRYLNELRLQEACRLLAVEGESIESVSEKLKFSSAKYFSAVFCKGMGVPPTKYRHLYREFIDKQEAFSQEIAQT